MIVSAPESSSSSRSGMTIDRPRSAFTSCRFLVFCHRSISTSTLSIGSVQEYGEKLKAKTDGIASVGSVSIVDSSSARRRLIDTIGPPSLSLSSSASDNNYGSLSRSRLHGQRRTRRNVDGNNSGIVAIVATRAATSRYKNDRSRSNCQSSSSS